MSDLAINEYFPESSQLVYGCMGLGGGWNPNGYEAKDVKQAQEIIETCLAKGINTFDLADIYTFGKAESVVGEVLKQQPSLRNKMIIQSKVGIKLTPTHDVKSYDLSPVWIKSALEASLKRLQVEQLDVLFLHRPDPLMDLDDTAEMLTNLQKQGKFKHLAVSNMHAAQIAWIQSAIDFPIIANQIEMSLAHADFVEESITTNMKEGCNSGFPRGTLEFCEQQSVQLQAWGCLAQGMYSGNLPDNPSQAQLATEKLLKQMSNRYSSNPNAILLSWLMKHPIGIQPVIGSTNIDRIIQCTHANKVELSREDWYLLFETARGQEVP
ncbi:aldo/keto reductase family oxidoreductase [Glaciecola sp. KUL10]|uniref:aldo/keto reductase n=1 Tax=Glaciecola sp. (strain KUL10) TaxID=2161813 RepID=UPI000D7820D2|nr:aldo/keto reductase [Glaciecola sp. KUL10]GBL05019.1 oxidoreductase, aldo/keto reductase family protein [Glaciecola sp. KUL10]